MYKWLLGAAALAAVALPARADFIVTISAGGQSVTVDQATSGSTAPVVTTAGGATILTAPADGTGFVIVGASVGGYTISTTASDNNSPGQNIGAHIALTNTTITNVSASGPLTITENTTGPGYASFTQPIGQGALSALLATSGPTTVKYTETQVATLNGGPPTITNTVSQNGGNVTKSAPGTTSPPFFNLGQTITLSGLAVGSSVLTNQANVQFVVPEPASALLALLGAPVLGFIGWRKRRVNAAL